MNSIINSFLFESSIVTLIVIAWLSLYFIATIWVFLYRSLVLSSTNKQEKKQLDGLIKKDIVMPKSNTLSVLVASNNNVLTKEMLQIWKSQLVRNTTKGLVILSVVSSTAPFIGLFGTVVEILEAFRYLGGSGNVSFDVIAPIISKALVATACGILVAIPAYSFYLILKRKAYEIAVILQMQIDVVMSRD